MTSVLALPDIDTVGARAWLARPALPYALDIRCSAPARQWLECVVPQLDALLGETLAFPQLARFGQVRELPAPLPHMSWGEALKRYADARLRAAGRLDAQHRRLVRALVTEFVHVVRLVLKPPQLPVEQVLAHSLLESSAAPEPCVQGFCDAALRADGRAALGVVLRAPGGAVLARIAVPTRAQDVVQAEAQALVATLSCAQSLRLSRLRLHTDASALASLLNGKGALAYCIEECQAQHLAHGFAQLTVLKVPRLMLFEADRLAAHALALG